MAGEELKERTKRFALGVMDLVESLPRGRVPDHVGNQLLRSGTSPGANYRAACRAKSRADFVSKMGTEEKELDESMSWMELLEERKLCSSAVTKPLNQECDELLPITMSSIKTARGEGRRTGGAVARRLVTTYSAFRIPHSALRRGGGDGHLG